MKKSSKILLTLVIIVAIAGFGVIRYIEIQTENILTQELAKIHVTVGDVDYNHIFNTLEFTDIKGSYPGNAKHTVSAEYILLTEPNLQSLNPQGETYPQVAEEIFIKNSVFTYEIAGKSVNMNAAQMRIKGYRQNIGKIAMVMHRTFSEEFFGELLNAYMDNFEILDVKTTSNLINNETNSTKRIFLKDITPQSIGLYEIENIASINDHGKAGRSETFYTNIANVQVRDLKYPSPQLLAKLVSFFTAQKVTSAQKEELLKLITQYFLDGVDNELKIQNLDTGFFIADNKENISILALQELKLQGKYDKDKADGLELSLELLNSKINVAAVDKGRLLAIAQSMLKNPVIQNNMSLKVNFHHKGKLSKMTYALQDEKLGNLQTSWEFMLPWPNEKDMAVALAGNADLQSILRATLSKDFHFSFDDKGLLARILLSVSKLNKMPLEQAEPLLQDYISKYLNNIKGLLTENNASALRMCLKNPGKLSFDINFDAPMSSMAMTWIMLRDPKELPLKILCSTGETLLEFAKKLQ